MELKTDEVAKELGMAPRTVRKWVKKYKIPCSKNDYGHYVYDQTAIALLETLRASSETAGALEGAERANESKTIRDKNQSEPIQHQLDSMQERINRTEQLLDQKADEVVSYQLLQQRKEIEDLTKRLEELESIIEEFRNKSGNDDLLVFDDPAKDKRRGVFRSIFGL